MITWGQDSFISFEHNLISIGHFHDGVIYYNYQNPLGFCFLVLIRAKKGKTKGIMVIVEKGCHDENGLLRRKHLSTGSSFGHDFLNY